MLTERVALFADHVTRGRRIFVQGTPFRRTDAEGADLEVIMVMAHFVELLGQPITGKMAESVVIEATTVHTLPAMDFEEEIPF